MEKIYEILLIVTAAIGIYASFVLLFISKQNSLLNRLLAFFWIIVSIFSLLTFCTIRKWTPDFIILIRTFIPIYYLIPTTCYLYFRTFIHDDVKLNKKDLVHLIPISLNLLYVSPLLYAIVIGDIHLPSIIGTAEKQIYFYNYGPIPDRFHIIFRFSVMLFYTFSIWKLHFSKNFRDFVSKNQAIYPFSIRWINFYIVTITVFAMSATFKQITLFYFPLDKNLFFDHLIPISSILIFDILIIYALLNPVILFGLPHFQLILESQIKTKPLAKSGFEEPNTNKFTTETIPTSISNKEDTLPTKNSGIDNESIEREDIKLLKKNAIDAGDENEKIQLLIQRINDYIEKHQPYRAIEFNILMLSKALHVPQHHLIYVFKIVLKKSFVDFRNELRISYVIKAIESGKLKNLTMDAISSEAGFASRTTFYAVFKKHIGITPGQYIDELGIRN